MADRAIELLNDRLKIYNVKAGEYLNLVGDDTRVAILVTGEYTSQIKYLTLSGVDGTNSDNYKLYWTLIASDRIFFYKDNAGVNLVASATLTSPPSEETVNVIEENSSGITGIITFEYFTPFGSLATSIIYVGETGFAQVTGNHNAKINTPNTGAISNPLEYLRGFNSYLVDQLNLTTASDDWLDYIGKTFYNISRSAGETDAAYSQRIIETVVAIKFSPLALKNVLENYGDNVQIVEGIDDGAFSDVSFSDNARNYNLPGEWVVKAALAGDPDGFPFFFRVIMENVAASDRLIVINVINSYRAAGVSYIVQID